MSDKTLIGQETLDFHFVSLLIKHSCLRQMAALLREATLIKLFYLPSEKWYL